MAKRIKTLEKDCFEYRQKYEKCNKTLLNMASDRQAQDQYVGKASRQLSQLQKLCRTLQAERNVLVELLKTHNIERPQMPELPEEPKDIEPPPKPADKLDIMSRNCDDLKRTLAQLQNQMNAMSIDKEKIEEKGTAAQGTAAANKKSKNKKLKTKTESKVNASKMAAAKGQSVSSAASSAIGLDSSAKASDSVDDKPLAELVTKVLAENPPPIEFLEKVLTSDVLANILSEVPEEIIAAAEDANGTNVTTENTDTLEIVAKKDVPNAPLSNETTVNGASAEAEPAAQPNGQTNAEPIASDAIVPIPNGASA